MSTWGSMLEGDKDAFLLLYQNNYQALFRYGFGIAGDKDLTKDIIQELFLEIWNTRATLNQNVQNVQSYLFTWLRRKISRELAKLSKDQLHNDLSQELGLTQASYEDLLIAFQQSEEKKAQLRAAMKKLTSKQLEIIKLKFFENLSYRTIAEQTSLTPRTVYNVIYEAIKTLRESMRLLFILFTI